MNGIIESAGFDPFANLALEEALFAMPFDGTLLYLWQNRNTVVIGRNQNAFKECHVRLLEDEGGTLARRSTGGGAVFHDLGNLNFSFITAKGRYDVARQLSVVTRALAAFGLRAEITGRNDIELLGGGKFSGSAYRLGRTRCLHHGTLLVDADMERLARYLAPSPLKLAAKGVASVRARVTNLSTHAPALTVARMKAAMREAFAALYGPVEDIPADMPDPDVLAALTARYASRDWRFGNAPAFDMTFETRFIWGGAELNLHVHGGRIENARFYTDAMDESLSERVEEALRGADCTAAAMAERLWRLPDAAVEDVAAWLSEQSL